MSIQHSCTETVHRKLCGCSPQMQCLMQCAMHIHCHKESQFFLFAVGARKAVLLTLGALLLYATPSPAARTCDCWPQPNNVTGNCNDALQLKITLAAASSSGTGTGQTVYYSQCIYQPSYDSKLGRLVFSYCWNRACLPASMQKSDLTATLRNWKGNLNQ